MISVIHSNACQILFMIISSVLDEKIQNLMMEGGKKI